MKKIYFVCLITIIVLLGGYIILTKNNNQTNTTVFTQKDNASQDQKFDLNINALSYQLPTYTKICLPESRYDCSLDGCQKGKPVVFVLYDENANKIYRCDKQPCDSYNISKEVSNLYTNLTPITQNGSLVKLSDDNEYVETVSIGLDFIIYRGQCTDKK